MQTIGRPPLKRRRGELPASPAVDRSHALLKRVAATFGAPVPSFSRHGEDMNNPPMRDPCLANALFLSALLLLPVSMTNAAQDEPLCILAPPEMPSAWKRWGDAPKSISERPWSDAEKADVAYALRKGLDELKTYYAQQPSAISQLGDDAAASFLRSVTGRRSCPRSKPSHRGEANAYSFS